MTARMVLFYPQYLHFSNKIDDVSGKGNRNIKEDYGLGSLCH